MRHVGHHGRAHAVRDLPHAGEVDPAWVGAVAHQQHGRAHLLGLSLDGVVVDELRLAVHRVGVDLVELAAEVGRAAVGQVAAGREVHPHHPVPDLADRLVDGGVGLAAGVRLHVHVGRPEELSRAVLGEGLDLVHDLAAAVVAPAGVSLGVLVGEQGPERLQDRRAGEVLARDELQGLALAAVLLADQAGDRGVGLLQRVEAQGGGSRHGASVGSRRASPPGRDLRTA